LGLKPCASSIMPRNSFESNYDDSLIDNTIYWKEKREDDGEY